MAGLYDDLAMDAGSGGLDWTQAGPDAILDAVVASLGALDLGSAFRVAESGASEAGGFPVAGDLWLVEFVFQRGTRVGCSEDGPEQGPDPHYDAALETPPPAPFGYVGTATSDFSTLPASTALALQYPVGHWVTGDGEPVKAFAYDAVVGYEGHSDFHCWNWFECWAACDYLVFNTPKIVGIAAA